MKLVIVTGMSGGGKSTTLKMLEDMGYYCADNLPISLISKFTELANAPGSEVERAVLGIDVRQGSGLDKLPEILRKLRDAGYDMKVMFLESSDQTLLKRYKETRRLHPLAQDGSIAAGIARERELLKSIREISDYVLDTSSLLTRELKSELEAIFVEGQDYKSLNISILSFGFKNGIPADADLVFDVRFLPNPFYIDELKHKTGLDKEVRDYVLSFEEARIFLDKTSDLLNFLIPGYISEGKSQLVIAIGCTGGQHRSVTLAIKLHELLNGDRGYGLKIFHRDVRGVS